MAIPSVPGKARVRNWLLRFGAPFWAASKPEKLVEALKIYILALLRLQEIEL